MITQRTLKLLSLMMMTLSQNLTNVIINHMHSTPVEVTLRPSNFLTSFLVIANCFIPILDNSFIQDFGRQLVFSLQFQRSHNFTEFFICCG